MPFTLTMPKLSPTMERGTITKWCKNEGDFVEPGEVLIEVATDKATVEYEAIDEGWLRKIIVTEGDDAIINQPIAVLTEEEKESIDTYKPEGLAPAVEETIPVTDTEEAPKAAKQSEAVAFVDQTAGLRQPTFAPEVPLEDYEFNMPSEDIEGRIAASPLARSLAREQGLDLSTVKGSGPSGRVMSEDLVNAQKNTTVAFGRRENPLAKPGEFEEEKMTPMRRAIGERLQESKTFIPHYYVTQKIDAMSMFETRKQLKSQGIKVTFNDFVVRAAALSLREHPVINTGFNSVNNSIVHFKTIDISVAVSLEGGLITPIVRHADFKNIGQISVEVKDLVKKAREGKLEQHEYRGGSFTISNLGMYGISDFTAIINPPQAAILAVGGILDVPVVQDGLVVPGKTMSMTMSSDHRIIDGAAAADFLKTMRKYLENPATLLL